MIAQQGGHATDVWLQALRRYLMVVVLANLVWEIAHLPLYTIWRTGTAEEIAFAVLHCTGGDALIATVSLVLALLTAGRGWPTGLDAFRRVAVLTTIFGVGYTIFSEWLNTTVRNGWQYSDLMPVLPPLHVGLSPIAQWIAIPIAGFVLARGLSLRTISATGELP